MLRRFVSSSTMSESQAVVGFEDRTTGKLAPTARAHKTVPFSGPVPLNHSTNMMPQEICGTERASHCFAPGADMETDC